MKLKALIKRDLLSTKNVWLFVMLVKLAVWGFIFYLVLFQSLDIGQLIFIPLLSSAFLGYGLVSHVNRVEDLNRVNERMLQAPIKGDTLILSRYFSSFLLVFILLVINFFLGVVVHLFSGVGGNNFVELGITAYFNVITFLVIIMISVYLPFYFAKNSNVATWAIRIVTAFYIFYILVLPPLYFNWVHELTIPNLFQEKMGSFLLPITIGILIMSYFIAVWCYKLRKLNKNNILPITLFVLTIYISFTIALVMAESWTINEIRISLEEIEVEDVIIDSYFYEDVEEYNVFIEFDLTTDHLDVDRYWTTYSDVFVQVHVSGQPEELLGLNGFGVRLVDLLNSYQDEFYTYQTNAPNWLTKEEHDFLMNNYNGDDFQFLLQSKWLFDGEKELQWINE
ncbi:MULTISPECIES: ABC-2 transporter permease [Bacillaceae]|uniref:ABC-2 transporter permease n=1 Tax=Evansella alkalicola TaxID=745819 RepID=A0ABS6JQE0_9BACI|nr:MULTISPECIES: ABC-2 transporter permease [Bacillaceae]MBU9720655.1 ABC-2 transporter permease [Bacillus alkalicola]